ncbi:MAG: hypothetical protein ACI82H_000601, partial [Alphaproteobacteria bacterium]
MTKSRLSIFVIFAGVLLLVGTWTYFFFHSTQEERRIAQASELQSKRLSAYFKQHVEGIFRYADDYTKAARREYVSHNLSLASVERFIELFPNDPRVVSHIAIINRDGNPIFNSGAALRPGVSIRDRGYFKFQRDTPGDVLYVSLTQRGRNSGKFILRMVRKITQPDGSFGGVIFAAIEAKQIVEFFDTLVLGMSSSATLVGADKIVRARITNGAFQYAQNIAVSQLWDLSKTSPSGKYTQ